MTDDKSLDREQSTREFLKRQAAETALEQLPLNMRRILDEAEAIKKFVDDTIDLGIRTGIKIRELER